jgi:hypothetical protein
VSRGHRFREQPQAFLDPFLVAAVMFLEEAAQGVGPGPLQLLQAGPALEQIPDQGARKVVEPL